MEMDGVGTKGARKLQRLFRESRVDLGIKGGDERSVCVRVREREKMIQTEAALRDEKIDGVHERG